MNFLTATFSRQKHIYIYLGFLLITILFQFSCKKKSELAQVSNAGFKYTSDSTIEVFGNITDNGGSDVFERGVVIDTIPNSTEGTAYTDSKAGNGDFSVKLSKPIKQFNTYYFKTYAINKRGISYGDELNFTAVGVGCLESLKDKGNLSGEFRKNQTIEAGIYHVNDDIYIGSNSILTLMPGVTLLMGHGVGIYVTNGSALNAIGTPTCPIKFSGELKDKGYWGTLELLSSNTANKFEYCTFEYGGGYLGVYDCMVNPRYSYVHFNNCTFSNCDHIALNLNFSGCTIDKFDNCKFIDNEQPLKIQFENAQYIGKNNSFIRNTKNYIELISLQQQNAKLIKQMVPYFCKYIVDLNGYKLSIEPGVELIMGFGSGLGRSDKMNKGSFEFLGTKDEHITIRGEKSQASYWYGITMQIDTATSTFSYVDFSDAGSPYWSWTTDFGIIRNTKDNPGNFSINNCSFANSTNYAVGIHTFKNGGINNRINGSTDSTQWIQLLEVSNKFNNITPGKVKIN